MPEDKSILDAIGSILQRWELNKAKKKKRAQTGLQSKIRDPQSTLSPKEKLMLKSQLLGDKIGGRTDEGAMMGIRKKFPHF